MTNNNMGEILLTIAIPTFNRSKELYSQLHSINSILSETKISKNVEVLVSDNCSTDSTSDVTKEFSLIEKSYKFTSIRNSKNFGGEANFMSSTLNASGRFVWLLSDDDEIRKDSIQYLFEALSSNLDIGFGFINFFLNKGEPQTAIPENDNYYSTIDDFSLLLLPLIRSGMVSACVFRKSLVSKNDTQKFVELGYPHMYCALSLAVKSGSLIIEKPLFTIIHPGVHQTRARAIARASEETDVCIDHFLNYHLKFLKFCSSLVDSFSVPFKLRYKLHRIMINESLNQIIFHKITSEKYDVITIKKAFLFMVKKYYFSPVFWLAHVPVLFFPSFLAKFIEPLRWKFISVRGYVATILRRILL